MRSSTIRSLLTVPALTAGLLVTVTLPATAAPPAAPAPAPVSPSTAALPDATITLVTGDQVTVEHRGGRQSVVTHAADRGDATAPVGFSMFVLRGDTFVVPSDAAPYLGGLLDWSLFDVSALVRAGAVSGAATPLTVVADDAGARPAVPGASVSTARPAAVPHGTDVSAASTASEPVASAATFGRRLALRLQADVAVAHGGARPASAGPDAFAGIRTIALDSATAHPVDPTVAGTGAAAEDPGFVMETLGLKAIGRDGKAPNADFAGNDGFFLVTDLDDPAGFDAEIPVTTAKQKWSVPAGTYDVRAQVSTWFQKTIRFDDGTVSTVWDTSTSLLWQPQVAVTKDTTLTFDARTANAVPLIATPDADTTAGWRTSDACCTPVAELMTDRTSTDDSLDLPFAVERGPSLLAHGVIASELFAAPSPGAVTKGHRRFYEEEELDSPATGHTYNLRYPSADGSVPPAFPTKVGTAALAAIPETFASEVPGRTGWHVRIGLEPWETTGLGEAAPVVEPAHITGYVLADGHDRTTVWSEIATPIDEPQYRNADIFTGPYQRFQPGGQTPVEWFAGPERPGVADPGTLPAGVTETCAACRTPNSIGFDVSPYVDGSNDHRASALVTAPFRGPSLTDTEELDEIVNGSLVASTTTATDPSLGSGVTTLPASPGYGSYELDYTVDRNAPWSSLATSTTTRWTFGSAPSTTTTPLPAGYTCGALTGACSVLPLVVLDYQVPQDEHTGVTAPGAVTFTVRGRHLPGATTTATIQNPSVQVSYDDGTSWQRVSAVQSAGGGTFRVTVQTPDPTSVTGFVSLKISDDDSQGSEVSQTVVRAFTLAGSAASRGTGVGDPAAGTPRGTGTAGTSAAVCAAPTATTAACDALVRTGDDGAPLMTKAATLTTPPSGYGPADIASAYKLPVSQGGGQTVALVDAPGDPNIAADLAVYRKQYGLPACTVANGCLTITDQLGDGPPSPPSYDPGWGLETALDLDAVSAACPKCHLMLVVADSASIPDLGQAVDTAVRLGADVVSNSYGLYENPAVKGFAKDYQHPGVPIVVSSGDIGFGYHGTLGGAQFPASVPQVTAVGGTRLTPDTGVGRGWDETAWNDGGSGCSAYFAKPSYQTDANCHMRTVADVAADADPASGLGIYDSAYTSGGGWYVVGGTSLAAPLIAAVYALAGNAATVGGPGYLYQHRSAFHDVTSGSNGYCGSTQNRLCNAVKGYDAPTGVGTPNGIGGL
ncbi:hypothetical protein ACXR2U_07750 [Jatrophihabitans sp. YIM 134969]